MHVENNRECTGCGACYNICPKSAITIKGDDYGFYKPFIDKEKCINCDLCEKICPLNKYKSHNIEKPNVYAFQYNDEETLYKCASGGVFAALAKYITERGGIVYGAIYDENMVVCHSRTDNLNDLEKMYSSKYVQSDTKYTYKQVKEDLEEGKIVLYSGTPCQIAGLKSYLQKNYEKLLTLDLICHGTPSPLIFEKYKTEFMAKLPKTEKLLNINFRSKIKGWLQSFVTTTTTTSSYSEQSGSDSFMISFLGNSSINTSCLNCQFNGFPRVGDITIGDFWGVDNYDSSMNDDRGLSIVLLNSQKGESIFNEIQNNNLTKAVPLEVAVKYNQNIIKSSTPNKNRIKFLNDIKKGKSLKYCVSKYYGGPLYMRIYRKLPQPVKNFIKYKIMKKEK